MLQVEGFCPLKIEITQLPDGFRLNHFLCDHLLGDGFNMILAIVKETIYVATKLLPPHKIRLRRIKRYYKD